MTKKIEFYRDLLAQTKVLISDKTYPITNMENISALLFNVLVQVNRVGFYRVIDKELVLGPFQGNVVCIRIPLGAGAGVCGTAAQTITTQRIDDVHQFDGHIACDASSNSEIVIPVQLKGDTIA
ncbi:GAF domain-containing protein [Candidatus Colwellia aromaticivorans]|uniref:GAF domain-containing protein n=1 Tax=Candidatus Colwellia aromaticivorans TaxID=2267621 RepID=UPI003CCC6299